VGYVTAHTIAVKKIKLTEI